MQSWWTLPKAFSKSIKTICRSNRNSLYCSMIVLTELMWSVYNEPAWSASIVEIRGSFIRAIITFANIFETAGRTQISRQLSHSLKLPFLWILMYTYRYSASGISCLNSFTLHWMKLCFYSFSSCCIFFNIYPALSYHQPLAPWHADILWLPFFHQYLLHQFHFLAVYPHLPAVKLDRQNLSSPPQ